LQQLPAGGAPGSLTEIAHCSSKTGKSAIENVANERILTKTNANPDVLNKPNKKITHGQFLGMILITERALLVSTRRLRCPCQINN
jgi:hypothetical protein